MENGVLFFYFIAPVTELFIKDLSLLFFNNIAPPKQTCSQRSKTYCLYNQDIKKYQVADNGHHRKKRGRLLKLLLFFK